MTERTITAILGAGSIGSSWAALFLAHGFRVQVWDPYASAEGLRARISAMAHDLGCGDAVDDRLVVRANIAEALAGARFVQESGPEDPALKHALFASVADFLDPDAIVASSTSTLMPSDMQEGFAFASRFLVGHPFNPPHIIPLVEVVPGRETASASVDVAVDVYRRLDRHPIVLAAERPGHLVNRLQAAVWREAIDAVASGLATIRDIDTAFTSAIGPRWSLMGPFLTFHLAGGPAGLPHFLDHLGPPFEKLWDDLRQPEMDEALKARLASQIEVRTQGFSPSQWAAWRDTHLPEVLALVADAQRSGGKSERTEAADGHLAR